MRANALFARGIHLCLRHIADNRGCLCQCALRLAFLRFGLRPAQMKQSCFGPTNISRKCFKAIGLTRLTFQTFNLATKLANDIFEAFKIAFSCTKAQFRLVAAGMKSGNAGGFFQKRATRLWLSLNKFANPALPHHGRRAGAG